MKDSIDERLKILDLLDEQQQLILFEDIYNEYYKLSFYIISKYINDYNDICDLVNDSFLNIYKNIRNVKKSIKYYIVVTSKNNALKFIKKQKYIVLDNDYINKYQDNINENYDYNSIHKIMKNILSEEEIEIIELHLLYNEKFKAIAKKKKIKEQTIKSIYYRAIKKIKEKSENYE